MDRNNIIPFPTGAAKQRLVTLDLPTVGSILKPCRHDHFLVNEKLAEVECADCHAKLNPMFVLTKLARKESRLNQRIEEFNMTLVEVEKRTRCKCQHCGKMTNIRV